MSEHHLTKEAILNLNIDNYKLGAYYCRKITKSGGVCICICKSYQYVNLDLDKYCSEQDIEVCAIRLRQNSRNLYVLSIYSSPSGNLNVFIERLEELLNKISRDQDYIVICGDFNANFITNKQKKIKLHPY
jgi:exonuclease III